MHAYVLALHLLLYLRGRYIGDFGTIKHAHLEHKYSSK